MYCFLISSILHSFGERRKSSLLSKPFKTAEFRIGKPRIESLWGHFLMLLWCVHSQISLDWSMASSSKSDSSIGYCCTIAGISRHHHEWKLSQCRSFLFRMRQKYPLLASQVHEPFFDGRHFITLPHLVCENRIVNWFRLFFSHSVILSFWSRVFEPFFPASDTRLDQWLFAF